MALTLAIENETQLPDGGPTSIRVPGRSGIDIGRHQHLDWTLPDPDRTISGKHCEIRYHDGAYWLHDLSRNGTFVNGSDRRLHEPHRLRNGDRLEIGRYLIAVSLDEDEPPAVAERRVDSRPEMHEIWGEVGDAAPPIRPAELRPPPPVSGGHADFLDWAIDVPELERPEPAFRPEPSFPPEPALRLERQPPDPPVRPALDVPPKQLYRNGETSGSAPPVPDVTEGAGDEDSPFAIRSPSADAWGRDQDRGGSGPHPLPAFEPSGRLEGARPPPEMPRAEGLRVGGMPDASSPSSVDPDMKRRLARGAGIPPEILATRDPGELAEELGALLHLIVENLKQLLIARSESRRLARGARETMVQAFDNNPIKFSPTAEDALRIMLGPPTKGYLDAQQTLRQSFDDLKSHQLMTYSAMQQAVAMLVENFDPKNIEKSVEPNHGLGAVIGSRKARLWDAYVARWEASTALHDNGLVDAFMTYFAECYHRNAKRDVSKR